METVVGMEGTDEAKFDDLLIDKTSSTPSSPDEIADPVVYKLVRVDGDGRLVPATDDEVMEVEDFLEDDKIEMHPAADDEVIEVEDFLEDDKSEMHPVAATERNIGCASNDDIPCSNTQFNVAEGCSENHEVVAEKSNSQLETVVQLGKLNAEDEDTVPSLATTNNDAHIDQPGTDGECSKALDGSIKSESSIPAFSASSKPDFSKLKGEICLDNLSVRELHETFKATFGRETSVKDKQWLKRRIAMGLTNSCDVTTTTFVIEDNNVVTKGKEESFTSVDGTPSNDLIVGVGKENCGGLPIVYSDQMENPEDVSGKRLRNPSVEYDCSVEDLAAAKRVRKPTRRYIEELSEGESREYSGKLISSVKSSGTDQSCPRVRPVREVWPDGRPVVTRQDSLGGAGVLVPYVCRVRRSRPRENFMALMKLQPNSMGVAAKLVKKALGARSARPGNEIGNKVFKARSVSGWTQKPIAAELEKEEHYKNIKASELEKDVELKSMDSSGDYSDDYVATVPTEKGGMRRKHHRPWTLSEVVKLVEGVARYGAGRWSEIKRLAFASYSYRTSVDLKDKWRNLMRASFAQSPAEKGVPSSRKQATVPIPAPILVRVRELAQMQAQVTPNFNLSKFAACSSRNVHETRSGYL